MGERLKEGFGKLLDFSIVGDVRGRGLLCGVEIVKDKAARGRPGQKHWKSTTPAMGAGCARNVGSTLAFAPPLVINADEVDQIVDILGSVIDGLAIDRPATPRQVRHTGAPAQCKQ